MKYKNLRLATGMSSTASRWLRETDLSAKALIMVVKAFESL